MTRITVILGILISVVITTCTTHTASESREQSHQRSPSQERLAQQRARALARDAHYNDLESLFRAHIHIVRQDPTITAQPGTPFVNSLCLARREEAIRTATRLQQTISQSVSVLREEIWAPHRQRATTPGTTPGPLMYMRITVTDDQRNALNVRDNQGHTRLIRSARNGEWAIVRTLMAFGADATIRDNNNLNAAEQICANLFIDDNRRYDPLYQPCIQRLQQAITLSLNNQPIPLNSRGDLALPLPAQPNH